MTEGQVLAWHAAEGDRVDAGADLLDIETSKIANAVEAPVSGILRRIVAEPGAVLAVGQLLGVISTAEVDEAALDRFVADFEAQFVPVPIEGEADGGPRFVDTSRRRHAYLRAGPAAGMKPPVVLLHGFGADANTWLFNIGALATERVVYALDLPGHGASSKSVDAATIPALAEAVVDCMDALGIGRAFLVGHSLGGALALALAGNRPDRVVGLVLIAPGGLGPDINADFIRGFIEATGRRDLKPVVEQLVADRALISRAMLDDILKHKRLDGATEALRAIADAVFPGGRQADDFRSLLGTLDVPVRIIWGARDAIIDPAQARGLPANVVVETLPDVGHMPHIEAAARVNELVRAALDA
jgi:pyruvate dehydrogenase E2 component (dihydrolipoamide acetyltransferase)